MELHLRRKAITAAVLVLVGVVTGPFGTFDVLAPWARLGYWLSVVVGVGVFMNLSVVLALRNCRPGTFESVLRVAAASMIAAVPGSFVVLGVEWLFRDLTPSLGFGLSLWGKITVIGFVVLLTEYRTLPFPRRTAADRAPEPEQEKEPQPEAPAVPALFLRNLSPSATGRLVSLSIEDHYLDVVTEAGQERILKRMADAVAELNGYPGMQIHRSHWVALDAIERLDRDGRRAEVVLKDGRQLPVSRPNVAALTEALADHRGEGN